MDADIYVLANDRRRETVIKVLNKYLPNRILQTGDGKYEFWNDSPKANDESITSFDTEVEFLDFLERQSGILFLPSFRPVGGSDLRVLSLYYN